MGVKYDVIFKDGAKVSREAVCFGSMAGGDWSWGNSHAMRPASEQSMIQFHTANNIHPIWGEPNFMANRREWNGSMASSDQRRAANRAYLTEMKILLDDLPWLQDVLTIHPLVGVVRAHIKTHAADKIITSLFLMRNLCNYGETAATYRHFRHQGLRPRLCAILAHYLNKNFGAMGRIDFTQQYLGEYNWINPQAFGKNAFMQMMQADKDTEFDFIQLAWADQRGYRRDNFYRENTGDRGITIGDDSSYTPERGGYLIHDDRYIVAEGWDWDSDVVISTRPQQYAYQASHLRTRNLVDCYGISGDVPFDNAMSWNPVQGMCIFNGPHRGSVSTLEVVDNFVAELERVCTEAGIPTRIE